MEPYRHQDITSNPRIDVYSTHPPYPPDNHILPRGEAAEYYNEPHPGGEVNHSLLPQASYNGADYAPVPATYDQIPDSNRLLPLVHDDPLLTTKKLRNQIGHIIRGTWRVLSLLLCITIIGLIVHILIQHARSRLEKFIYSSGVELPAWPDDNKLKLYPLYLFLAAAIVASIINFVALLSLIFVKIKFLAKLRPIVSIPFNFIAAGVWLGAVIYFKSWDKKNDNSEYDIWTWTCSHKEYEVNYGNSVIGFSTTCTEMTYIYYAGVWVFSLEILNLLAQIWNLFNSKRTTVVKPKKKQKKSTGSWGGRLGLALGGVIAS